MLWGLWAAEHALGFMGHRTCSGVYGLQNMLWGLWVRLTWAFFKKSHSMLCVFSFRHASIHVVCIICFCLSTLCIKQWMAVAHSDRKLTFCRLAHVTRVLSSRASPNQCTFLPSSHPEVTLCNRWEVKTQEQTSSQIGSIKSIVYSFFSFLPEQAHISVLSFPNLFKDMGTPINNIYMCIYIYMNRFFCTMCLIFKGSGPTP